MGNSLYLECNMGISGDMMVASLLDLGADVEILDKSLKSLGLQGFDYTISRVKKAGLDVCDFDVILEHDNHDHDMEYLYGHNHEHEHHYEHEHEHHHEHTHHHEHEHHHDHHHEHRGLKEIIEIIDNSGISDNAKKIAKDIFTVIAKAESKAHGENIENVHFHEVGAVDSIVDIVSVAVCLDNLDVDRVYVPFLCDGTGSVRCQHGILPIPVPAVVNIVQDNHIKLKITNISGEMVTPTGAAIVAAIKTDDYIPDEFFIKKTGLGAGKRNYGRPSILRAFLVEVCDNKDN